MSFTQTFPANLVKFSFLKELLPLLEFARIREHVIRLAVLPYPAESGTGRESSLLALMDSFGATTADELAKIVAQTFDEYRILDSYFRHVIFPHLPDAGRGTVDALIVLTDVLQVSAKDALSLMSLHVSDYRRTVEEPSVFLSSVEERYTKERVMPFTRKLETVAEGSNVASSYRDRYSNYIGGLATGMPAYAWHWNDLYNYAESILNYVGKIIIALKRKYGNNKNYVSMIEEQLEGVYLDCFTKLQGYEKLRTGDVIMPKHTNALIDIASCIDRLRKALLAIGLPVLSRRISMTERMRINITGVPVIKVTYDVWGLEYLEQLFQPEVVLTYPWSWWEYRCLIDDDTIFLTSVWDWNTGEYLRYYLSWYKAVVGLVVASQLCNCPYGSYVAYPDMYPNYPGLMCWCQCYQHGSSYYAVPCDGGTVVDECMANYIPHQPPWPWSATDFSVNEIVDVCVGSEWKVPHATPWYRGPGGENCTRTYVRIYESYIIELPLFRMWESVDMLKRYIEALSRCLLKTWPPKRVVFNIPRNDRWCRIAGLCEYPTLEETVRELARRLGWNFRTVGTSYCR